MDKIVGWYNELEKINRGELPSLSSKNSFRLDDGPIGRVCKFKSNTLRVSLQYIGEAWSTTQKEQYTEYADYLKGDYEFTVTELPHKILPRYSGKISIDSADHLAEVMRVHELYPFD